ncbi:DUF4751 family protein [Citrobacter rodentium]|uniref:DUF4751 domain-containing protein n=2 Tax=Citrobacter rodentium TaxID=67825 RepID=D2TGG6_CITRI|nr:cytoplasmic protein [Citrobacter rodentium]UHO31317.1 DUF4751 family protein [Citrobacter rodentium NBRC 105723 = DSM 16636]CBG86847.1 conserved hypothetical protein [Citrobacter rodentium ICC168]QBY31321.1 DUF4751 domain-containing protein [Citrobacter rodentium]HAT8014366.1 DUF4751 domain-containing protein [Citrobacter rodentium NBRC 105723 = DSM 16636]
MNVCNHMQQSDYLNYFFVNTLIVRPYLKTVSRFIEYKTWTGQIWRSEVIEDGNAFFHWQGTDRINGHRDTVINYFLHGQKWQSTITDYIFFHSLEGEEVRGYFDNVIKYVSPNSFMLKSTFAECVPE